MQVRVFDIDKGIEAPVELEYKSRQAPREGELIFTEDGDWLVREVSWVPLQGGKIGVSVIARWMQP